MTDKQFETVGLDALVSRFFKARISPILEWNGVRWLTWTPLEKYWFGLYPPGRTGSPNTDHLYLLRIDSRRSGTGFRYADDPEELLLWAKIKMSQERKLDTELVKAWKNGDEGKAKQLEAQRFTRCPITA